MSKLGCSVITNEYWGYNNAVFEIRKKQCNGVHIDGAGAAERTGFTGLWMD